MVDYKKLTKIMLVILSLSILSFSVSAFGIVMPYWEGRPLVMEPGETKDVALTLQNVGTEDITLQVTLTKGSEIAKITDKSLTYTVPKGTVDTKINLGITIPPGEAVGNNYVVGISIKDISPLPKGMVQLTNSIDKYFDVMVGSKPLPPPTPSPPAQVPAPPKVSKFMPVTIILVILFAIVTIAFYLHTRSRKQSPKQKKVLKQKAKAKFK